MYLQSDDITVKNIPIGFTFVFCGTNYTQISACSNGWLSFANTSSTQYTNSLSNANSLRPVLMPLFDDLYGGGGVSKYRTTGTAPNRVFMFEWKDWRPLSYTSSKQISFQVLLYEGTNAIEFRYKREGSSPLPSATIGIMWSSADYQVLPIASSSPVPSKTVFYTSLNAYPATNQVYRWDPPTPCTMTSNLTMGVYSSTYAAFSWTGNTDALSYDYAVDTNAAQMPLSGTTITNTTSTSGSVVGLKGGTRYYIHVRSRCSPYSLSQWDTMAFVSLPPCAVPKGFIVSYIDSNSANFQWNGAGNVLSYQYVVSTNRNSPAGGYNTTTIPYVSLPDTCRDGTLYYVHIRSLCVVNDSSSWSLDSFRTPVPCRRPALSQSFLSHDNSVISWPHVPTAVSYEYYLGDIASLPLNGTPILSNSIQTPYLVPATNYTMSVRCNCLFYGVKTQSLWASLDFTTPPPASISGLAKGAAGLWVAPNPASDILYVEMPGVLSEDGRLQLYNVTGKMIKEIPAGKQKMIHIDVREYPAGVYVLKYVDRDDTKTAKVVIQ